MKPAIEETLVGGKVGIDNAFTINKHDSFYNLLY